MTSQHVGTLLIGLALILLGQFLFSYRDLYLVAFNGPELYQRYQNSAYFRGDKSDYVLSDAEVNVVRGWQLVDQKADLTAMLPGHPPFGSFLFGLSAKYLGNPLWASLLSVIAIFWLLYWLGSRLLGALGTGILLLIFSLEPLVKEQLTTTMLDGFLLALLLSSVCCYLKWWQTSRVFWIFCSQFLLGLGLATKFWPAGFPLLISLYLSTVFSGQFRRFCFHTFALGALAMGFVLGHWQFFVFHPSLLEFARYQRYLISWWAGSPQVDPGAVFDLVFSNRWHTWWGKDAIVPVVEWWFGWPAAFVLGGLSTLILLAKKQLSTPYLNLALWSGLSILMFTFSATYPRHLLVALPGLYLLALRLLTGGCQDIVS